MFDRLSRWLSLRLFIEFAGYQLGFDVSRHDVCMQEHILLSVAVFLPGRWEPYYGFRSTWDEVGLRWRVWRKGSCSGWMLRGPLVHLHENSTRH